MSDQSNIQNQKTKPTLKIVELDDFPTPATRPRNTVFDEAIQGLQTSTKGTIGLDIDGKAGKQLYSTLHSRVMEFNKNPNREFNIQHRTIANKAYLKKVEKGKLP
jgi:hypothetical protein